MALDLQRLANEVAEVVSTQASAVKVIDGLKDELRIVSAKLAYQDVDTSALDELIEKLDHSTDALASAIASPVAVNTDTAAMNANTDTAAMNANTANTDTITVTPFDSVPPPPSDVGH